ncbi:PilX N-terminal domain-containing pilus assembly protein [Desulfogranum japonicum]|uniref:PilX N-terminal domain-containing pilus assembly protein n=1 Tax=Desulfogranum japonicum TaxID=231447 RepID=UPI00040DA138|nr:PilX N-terminal domain-containing pilus assembly protein [Desulfogranum japonicum]
MSSEHDFLKNDSGFVLIIALLILIMLSLLGVYAITTSVFELRVAGNDRFAKQTFFRADSGTQVGIEMFVQNMACEGQFVTAPPFAIAGVDVLSKTFADNRLVSDIQGATTGTTADEVPSDIYRDLRIPDDPSTANSQKDTLGHTNIAMLGVTRNDPGEGGQGPGNDYGGPPPKSRYMTIYSQHVGLNNNQAQVQLTYKQKLGELGTCRKY